jgi:hypothetical protein
MVRARGKEGKGFIVLMRGDEWVMRLIYGGGG